MKVIAVNIGERKEVQWKSRTVTTGIFKYPVQEAIVLGKEDVVNDNVIDREHHGGIDQAAYAYATNHYDYWKEQYPDLEWDWGMFGENISIEDLDETQIHVGNQYKIGEALVEVTKPRQPCFKLGIRFNNMKVVKQFWNSTMSGLYFKVLQTGAVKAGDILELQKECPENPTIAEVYEAKRLKNFK